ncbi:hypothetical protein, partial [Desulfocicer niacini]
MNKVDIDHKLILFEAIRDSLVDVGISPDEVAGFEFAYNGMYEMARLTGPRAELSQADAPGLIGEQLVDATVIAVAFAVGKFFLSIMINPILENKILPNIDRYEEELIGKIGHPRLVKSVRKHIEKTIRKQLKIPSKS